MSLLLWNIMPHNASLTLLYEICVVCLHLSCMLLMCICTFWPAAFMYLCWYLVSRSSFLLLMVPASHLGNLSCVMVILCLQQGFLSTWTMFFSSYLSQTCGASTCGFLCRCWWLSCYCPEGRIGPASINGEKSFLLSLAVPCMSICGAVEWYKVQPLLGSNYRDCLHVLSSGVSTCIKWSVLEPKSLSCILSCLRVATESGGPAWARSSTEGAESRHGCSVQRVPGHVLPSVHASSDGPTVS